MKYIAFFDTLNHQDEERSVGLSSVNVVEYMANTLAEISPVELVSPTRTLRTRGYFPGRKEAISQSVTLVQPPTIGVHSRFGRTIAVAYTQIWLLDYLLRHTSRGETVVAYHSLSTMLTLRIAKRMKRLNLCLEIREIYTDINDSTNQDKAREHSFFQIGDAYIFPTSILNELINHRGKPHVIASGIYSAKAIACDRFSDGKIHVVYAGTFRPAKGGALMAIRIGEFLNENYHLHILGEGTPETKQKILNEIERVQTKSLARVTYDGVRRGNEFDWFLQKCHIGLSTQTPEGEYNASSFPSKILTYLSNGLEVLSVRIPAVETSPVGDHVHYYDNNDPQVAADVLMAMGAPNQRNHAATLDELHQRLVKELEAML